MTRLIDADAFCEFLRRTSTRQNYSKLALENDNYTVAGVLEAVCEDLEGKTIHGFDNAPTVEARTKSEWIYHNRLNMYFCKECGLLEPLTKEEVEEGAKLPNFCEQCGADMRKDGES